MKKNVFKCLLLFLCVAATVNAQERYARVLWDSKTDLPTVLVIDSLNADEMTIDSLECVEVHRVDSTIFSTALISDTIGIDSIYTANAVVDHVVVDSGVVIPRRSFWKNWYIGAGVGLSSYFGESDRYGPWSGRISPAIDLFVGKWITPTVGLRMQYTGYENRGYIEKHEGMPEEYFGELAVTVDGRDFYKQKWTYSHFKGDVIFDLTNAIWGYKEDRVYSFQPFVGFGIVHSSTYADSFEFAGTLGLINRFRVSDNIDLNLEIKATMLNDHGDVETLTDQNKLMEGFASATVGITYRFDSKGWSRYYRYAGK